MPVGGFRVKWDTLFCNVLPSRKFRACLRIPSGNWILCSSPLASWLPDDSQSAVAQWVKVFWLCSENKSSIMCFHWSPSMKFSSQGLCGVSVYCLFPPSLAVITRLGAALGRMCSMFLRNVGIYLRVYTTSQPGRTSSSSPP
jgi:hypothetical protein